MIPRRNAPKPTPYTKGHASPAGKPEPSPLKSVKAPNFWSHPPRKNPIGFHTGGA